MPVLLLHDFCQMDAKLFQPFITSFFIFIAIPICFSDDNQQYEECRSSLYECGELKGIGYPFWGDARPQFCGLQGFELKCQVGDYPLIHIDSLDFRVLNISLPTYTMTIARTDFWNETCPKQFNSTTLNYTLFDYSGSNQNLTLFYGCSDEVFSQLPDTSNITKQNFTCEIVDSGKTTAFYVEEALLGLDYRPILESCDINVTLPVSLAALDELLQAEDNTGDQVSSGDRLEKALNKGFDVNYGAVSNWCMPCNASGGICGSSGTYPYNCFCPDDNKSYPFLCPKSGMFPLFFAFPSDCYASMQLCLFLVISFLG